MTRPIGATLLTHAQGTEVDIAKCVMLQAVDGTRIGFTTSDVAITADLGEGDGVETYSRGMRLSQLVLQAGFEASYFEMAGPIGPAITRDALSGGRWKNAQAWLFFVSRQVPGELGELMYGLVREAREGDDGFVMQVRSEQDRFNQDVGGVLSLWCDVKTYGDSRCKKAVETVDATVSSVTDDMHFGVTFTGSYATGFFAPGKTLFTSGVLVGIEADIFSWTSAGAGVGSIEMKVPLVDVPAVGDLLTIKRDCGRRIEDCVERGNGINFRGEPDLSGTDDLLRPAIPGSVNE